MTEPADIDTARQLEMTTAIVSAYVSNNHVQPAELTALMGSVHAALGKLGNGAEPTEPELEKPTPAQVRKSITHEALISFIDGKPYKTLKRHVARHGFEPQTYRERFGLPADYPMTAPSYSEHRAVLARSLGLGRKAGGVAEPAEAPAPAPKRRGRPKTAAPAG